MNKILKQGGARILAYRYYCKLHRWWLARVYGMDIGDMSEYRGVLSFIIQLIQKECILVTIPS